MISNVGLKGLRGTLETALESDDISPLIKLVSSSSTARQTTEADDGAGNSASPSASPAGSKREEGLALAEGTLNGVVHTLQGISERRDLELKRTCQANSSEIASSLRELAAVQATSADLRRRAQETSASMQRMGAHFSSRMDALDEALLVRDRIQQTRSALQSAMHIISLCQEVAESMETGQLHHARRVLLALKTRYGPALKASAAAVGDGERAFQFPLEGLPAAQQLGSLGGKLLARINELDSKVDVRLTSCLNEWLTQARAVAGTVGRSATELVEAEKKRNIALAQQRRQMMALQEGEESGSVGKDLDVDRIAYDLKSKLSLAKNIASKVNTVGGANDNNEKNIDADNGDESNISSDPASLVDMKLLLRCVHVHSSENTLSQLLESYVEARQAQLGADLAPPGDLLIFHRAFLWQIVGFFVIETRVGLVAPHLETSAHAEASWEGASAALAAELGAAIDEASRPEDIRELKKQALLACDAIDMYCGDALSTRGIRSTLTSRVERVRATMASGVAAALEEASTSATGIASAATSMNKTSISSRMEALVTKLSGECSDYMSGLVEDHDLPAATCIEVDHILAAAISAKVAAFVIKDGQEDNNHQGAYLTSDDESEDSSYDPQDDEEDEDEEEYSGSDRSGSSLYSDGDDSESSSRSSRSGGSDSDLATSESIDTDNEDDDNKEKGSDGQNAENEEEEELFVELLQLVSIAAAAESALNTLRQNLLGSTCGNSSGGGGSAVGASSASLVEKSQSSSSSFSSSSITQLSGSLMATEDAAGRRIAYSAYTALDALADLEWSPESMPRTAGSISSQCAEILEVLEAGRSALESCGAPGTSQQRILGAAVRRIEEEIMRLLVSDAVPYVNVFGAQRLLSDLHALSKFVSSSSTPTSTSSELVSEPVLFGELVAFNKASELLDSEKRGGKYASVNLDRIIVLLEKVKDPVGPSSAVGRGFIKAADARKVASELKNILTAERGS